jgi:hypothetical protein
VGFIDEIKVHVERHGSLLEAVVWLSEYESAAKRSAKEIRHCMIPDCDERSGRPLSLSEVLYHVTQPGMKKGRSARPALVHDQWWMPV